MAVDAAPSPPGQDFADWIRSLHESWANLDPGEDGWPVAAAHMRAAYGTGYLDALSGKPSAVRDLPSAHRREGG